MTTIYMLIAIAAFAYGMIGGAETHLELTKNGITTSAPKIVIVAILSLLWLPVALCVAFLFFYEGDPK